MATIDGINFSNIQQRSTIPSSAVWTHADNVNTNGKYDYDGGKSVMSLDIDWNGAILPNGDIANGSSKTINTTGDLLALIDKMNEQIYALAAAVIAIGSKVSN